MVTIIPETIGVTQRNQARRTNNVDHSYWTKSNVSVTSGQADPNGGTDAQTVADTASGSLGYYERAFSGLTNNQRYCWSLKVKRNSASASRLRIYINGGTTEADLYIDWSGSGEATLDETNTSETGTAGYYLRPASNIYSDIDGWYRLEGWIRYNTTEGGGSADLHVRFYPDAESGTTNATYVAWHQFEADDHASLYQEQTTSANQYLGDYSSVSAWLLAHDNEDMVSADVQYVGQIMDGAHVVDADVLEALNTAGNTDATRNRVLTWADNRYDPRTNAGPRIIVQWVDNTAAQEGLRVTEDYFTLDGVGISCEDPREADGASSVDRSAVRVEGDHFRMVDTFVRVSESANRDTSPSDAFYSGVIVDGADDASFYNCAFLGGAEGRGGTVAIQYTATATNGGIYGCCAYRFTRGTARGFMTLRTTSSEQELMNSIAIDCHANGGLDFSGTWGRRGYNVTSDAQAESVYAAGTTYDEDGNAQVGAADANSYTYVDALDVWIRPGAQDFRPRQNSAAQLGGRDETTQYNADSIDLEDLEGVTRQEPWAIGAIETAGAPPTSVPSETIDPIGPATTGRAYRDADDWLEATEGLSLVARNEILVGEVYNDLGPRDLGQYALKARWCLTDQGRYRHLRGAPGRHRWTPHLGVGAKYETFSEPDYSDGIYIGEDHFRLTGIEIEEKSASGADRRSVRIQANGVCLDSVSARMDIGSGADAVGILVAGSRCLVLNSLVVGGGTAAGAITGIRLQECSLSRVYQCVVYDVRRSTSLGFHEGPGTDRVQIKNSIAATCDTCFSHDTAGNADSVQSHNISTDATADGPGSQVSVAVGSIFVDAAGENFRLPVSSVALDKGENLSFWVSTDVLGVQRVAPFDIGIYEGVGSVVVIGKPPKLSSSLHLCHLVEIIRTDGVGYFVTDANQPLVHGGRTYVPQDGVAMSALRGESGLAESSVSLEGMIAVGGATTDDLLAGRWVDAVVTIRTVDCRFPWLTPIETRRVWLGPGKFDGNQWQQDGLGIGSFLEQPRGELNEVGCPAKFGSARCGYDLASTTWNDVRIASVSDDRRQFDANSTDLPSQSDGFFAATDDNLFWLTGDNANTWSRIKSYTDSSRTIVLAQETGFPIQTSDTFQIAEGCLKRYVEDCVAKSNGINFRGSPFITGPDAAFETLNT